MTRLLRDRSATIPALCLVWSLAGLSYYSGRAA